MDMTERQAGDVTVVELAGKLTLGDATTRLHDKINSVLHQGRRQLVLDLGGVDYVDSAGLGELVRTHSTVKKNDGAVHIANLSNRVQDLLTLTKLITVFEVFDTVDAAAASFKA
jgi:anti-sigma B factor antagonist